jgi:hypothetical protein
MLQDIQEAHVGQIVAVFGVDCASGQSFTCRVTNCFIFFIFFIVLYGECPRQSEVTSSKMSVAGKREGLASILGHGTNFEIL